MVVRNFVFFVQRKEKDTKACGTFLYAKSKSNRFSTVSLKNFGLKCKNNHFFSEQELGI